MQAVTTGTCEVLSEATPWGWKVTASGELDLGNVSELRRHLTAAINGGARRLLLDFGGVTFVDSISLAAVVAARRRLLDQGGRMAVATDSRFVLLILEATGLDTVFDVYPSPAEALAAIS